MTEALKHRITNQRYQHDSKLFALINRKFFLLFLLAMRNGKKTRVGSRFRQREKVNYEEKNSRKGCFLVWMKFPSISTTCLRGDVNATTGQTELREKHTRSLFFVSLRKGRFFLDSASGCNRRIMRSGNFPFSFYSDALHQKEVLNETFIYTLSVEWRRIKEAR